MPSACAKPETKASTEASETVKQCISIVEKKIRNLEKRKGKLDSYRERMSAGDELNQDQLEAIAKFDGVIQSLELARELQKSFQTMNTDIEKVAKKQAKREKFERMQREVSRTKDLLKLQSLLDSMGDESVRENFQKGTNGAIKLSEKQLEQLDELYKLMSPSREEGEFQDQLKQSSEHIVNILDGVDKPVIGTTYSALHQMISQIQECGYFDQATSEKPEESAAAPEEEAESAAAEPPAAAAAEEEKPVEEDYTEVPEPAAPEEIPSEQPSHVAQQQQPEPTQPHFQEESFFSTVAGFNRQPPPVAAAVPSSESRVQRPFQEIVSSVQGNFDFLQDSELEAVDSHPIDPAVVAAHPMVPSGNTDLSGAHPAAFQQNLLSGDGAQRSSPFTEPKTQSSSDSSASQSQLYSQQAAFEQSAQQSSSSSSAAAYSTEQTFSQSLMDNASISFGATSEQSTFMGEQPLSAGGMASESGPQPIPLPGQSLSEQSFPAASDSPAFNSDAPVSYSEAAYGATNSSDYGQQQYDGQYADDGTDKKTFTMNPNASIFRSMYQEPQQGGSSGGYGSNYNQRQGGGFSSHRSNNGAPRGGGGGRGGPKGGSSMNNGYARGGSAGPRGASSYGGTSNGRGGSSGNSYNRGGAGMRGAPSGRGGGGMRGSGGNRGGSTSYARSMQQGNMS